MRCAEERAGRAANGVLCPCSARGCRDLASQTVHIANVAFNSLFIGEILQPDWDMFQSSTATAALHAVARAVGGCAVYVSDHPAEHNLALLRRLVLPDGSVLRCAQPGRPTRDSLFADVVADGRSALKVWNRNACGGVCAAFNLQGARWDRAARRHVVEAAEPAEVEAVVGPRDVEGMVLSGPEGGAGQWAVLMTSWRADGEVREVEKQVALCGCLCARMLLLTRCSCSAPPDLSLLFRHS